MRNSFSKIRTTIQAGAILLILPLLALQDNSIEKRILEIHTKVLTIDTHIDTPMDLTRSDWDISVRHEPGKRASGQLDLPRMAEGGLDAAFFAAFVSQRERTPEGNIRARESAERILDSLHAMAARHPDMVGIALTPKDAVRLEKQGKRIAFLSMENGYPLGQDLSLVKHFYDRGVRCLTLCHTRHNDICDSSTDTTRSPWNGLSPFGEEVVKEINRLGMLIDVSHISDSAFWDVLRTSKAPVIASHSACRVLASSPRNLDDDMLRALADRGGVVQICLVSFYLKTIPPNPAKESALDSIRQVYGDWDKAVDPAVQEKRRNAYYAVMRRYPDPMATLAEFVDHIDHAVKIVGIDHVGFGSDLDGGGGVEECNDVTQYPRITEELVRRGYTEGQIRKIWGGNTLRVLDKVAGIARSLQKKEKKT